MAEIAYQPEVSDCGDRRLELSRNLNQSEVGWRTTGHLKIGHQVTIGAKSGVMRDIPSKATVLGVTAVPDRQTKRQWLGTRSNCPR